MATRFGAVAANALGAFARVAGYVIYRILRIIYRRRDKTVAGAILAAILAVLAVWWLLG